MAEPYIERAHQQIQIESWSNSAREILLRGHATGGPFAEVHTTNADRSRASDTFEIHGVPVSIQASPSAAPVRRGECYVRITLLLDGEPVQRLSAGYLTDSKTLSWPPGIFEGFTEGPGLIRVLSGTNPAAGAEWLETVPTNARWRILDIFAKLTTDANVANRSAILRLDDGSSKIWDIVTAYVHAASTVINYHWLPQSLKESTAIQSNIMVPLPPALYAFQGYRLGSQTTNFQAGDDWIAPEILIEEWIEE